MKGNVTAKKKLSARRARERALKSALDKHTSERLKYATTHSVESVFKMLGCDERGVCAEQLKERREKYGENVIKSGAKKPMALRIFESFVNPFSAILLLLAAVSVFTDIIFAEPGERNYATVIIICAMLLVSGIMKLVQDARSDSAAEKLARMINATSTVRREEQREILNEDIVVGDIVLLSAGDMIPADMRIIKGKDLFVSQSALTGESEPVEKTAKKDELKGKPLTDSGNLAFMGSNVISGSGEGIVLATGSRTVFGGIAKTLNRKPPKTQFERGLGKVSWLLIRFMLVMVPVVLLINGFTKGDWTEALLFAVSVAVGLTPEMMPMIVTAALAKGSVAMSKKKVIVKKLNAIQDLGAIDILCTDKTGTLTQDRVVLEKHMNVRGEEDDRVLRHAWLNSNFQTGLKNLIDVAVTERFAQVFGSAYDGYYTKVDELPFDFSRRRMSVIISDPDGKRQMVTKGAVEEMLTCCSHAEIDGRVDNLTPQLRQFILERADELNAQGMRVIAVAQKRATGAAGTFTVDDERDMVLMGYLAFLDPPKETTARAIEALKSSGVDVKILTGDNDKVTACICRKVGLDAGEILLGTDVDGMDDGELGRAAERITVFAKLSPEQKARVISALRGLGHTVGYMGDGINDAAAMKQADVGISVDTAVDIAKEYADVILLEKDLTLLRDGIEEGRKTYANTIKYIKMTASSNFGNMFSVLIASAFLPFLPMSAIQLVLLNLVYDISCTAIPWDNVDSDFLAVPRKWDASSISRFMFWFGPVSSLFDVITFAAMYFLICPAACGGNFSSLDGATRQQFIAIFRAGWFIQSIWTQTLVIHLIRTPRLPFIASRASASVTALTAAGIALLTALPFTPAGAMIGLGRPPAIFFALLASTIIGYMLAVTLIKKLYIKKYGELL